MMKGWKTWAAAGGLCLLGLYLVYEGKDDLGIQAILIGLGLVGIGHKVEKGAASAAVIAAARELAKDRARKVVALQHGDYIPRPRPSATDPAHND